MDSRVSTATSSSLSEYRDEESIKKEAIWKEMEKKYNISKRKHTEVMKLKKINTVAKVLLDSQMTTMQASFARTERELNKKRKQVEKELRQLSSENFILPPIQPQDSDLSDSPRSPEPCVSRTPEPPKLNSSFSGQCNKCRFGTSQGRCVNFPCCLPKTYTSIGFQVKPRQYSSLPNYDQMLRYSEGIRPPSPVEIHPEKKKKPQPVIKTPRISIKDRERGLKQMIKEMKMRNEKNKPKDWAVNYGKPLPRRLVLRPIIPSGVVLS